MNSNARACCAAAAGAVLLAFSASGLAFAQSATGSAPFVAAKINPKYGQAMSKLPDWNGYWMMGGHPCPLCVMFDVEHVYMPPDPAGETGGADFGILPGSYDTQIPYKPEYWKKYMKIVANNKKGMVTDPTGNCMQPHGMPRQMSGIPTGPEIIMTPDFVLMHWGYMNAIRHIYTDGRSHPVGPGAKPSFMGHSVGHWEGDTLVVDTVDMYAGQYDQSGAPYSDQVHLKERIRLIDNDTLENQMTIEDPVMLSKPWHVVRTYLRNHKPPNLPDGGYCSPQGDTTEYSKGYQNEVLPFEKEAAGKSK